MLVGDIDGVLLACHRLRLASEPVVRAGEIANAAVTRAVGKERRLKPRSRSRHDIAPNHRGDARRRLTRTVRTCRTCRTFNSHDSSVQKESDVRFGLHRRHLAVVFVLRSRLRIAAFRRPDLGNHVTESRIRPKVLVTAQMHAHLRRVRATQQRTILHQCNLESKPRRRNRRADAGNAAADHNEIRPCCRTLVVFPFPPQRLYLSPAHYCRRKTNRVAPPIKTIDVANRDRIHARLKRNIIGLDPLPAAKPLPAKQIRQFNAVNRKLERSSPVGPAAPLRKPLVNPVLGSDVNVVAPRRLDLERRRRVGDGLAETVREQIAGPHLVDELRINRPSAEVLELLAFKQNRLGRDRPSRAERHQCRHQPFHASFPFSITCQ